MAVEVSRLEGGVAVRSSRQVIVVRPVTPAQPPQTTSKRRCLMSLTTPTISCGAP